MNICIYINKKKYKIEYIYKCLKVLKYFKNYNVFINVNVLRL